MRLPKLSGLKSLGLKVISEIIEEAIGKGATTYVEEAIKIKNKMLGFKGSALRKQNTKDISKSKELYKATERYKARQREFQQKARIRETNRLTKISQKAGIRPKKGVLIDDYGVVSPVMGMLTKEGYIEERISERVQTLAKRGMGITRSERSEISKEAGEHYDKAKAKQSRRYGEIDRESWRKTDQFIDRYFKTATDTDGKDELKWVVKEKMNVKQRHDFMDTLKSPEFKGEWDSGSDQGNSNYDAKSSYHSDSRLSKALDVAYKMGDELQLVDEDGNVLGTRRATVTDVMNAEKKSGYVIDIDKMRNARKK